MGILNTQSHCTVRRRRELFSLKAVKVVRCSEKIVNDAESIPDAGTETDFPDVCEYGCASALTGGSAGLAESTVMSQSNPKVFLMRGRDVFPYKQFVLFYCEPLCIYNFHEMLRW